MSDVTINIARIAPNLEPGIKAAVRSVLEGAEPAWAVSVLGDKDSTDWHVGAQPGDEEPFHGVLDERHQSADDLQRLILGWYDQFMEWSADQ